MTDPLLQVSQRLYEVLGRQRIAIDLEGIGTHFRGKRVLITGAGGSIGSALAELLARVSPERLTLLDLHEHSLYYLRQQLSVVNTEAAVRYVLCDVRNARRIGHLLDEESPEFVFHMAAYKHVPFAEDLPEEFATVNVLGTWRLLQEARRAGVQCLIFPSTDKAVNPPSVYGATKRSAELILQAAAGAYPEIQIAIARLVNVLGARGGVIETFVRQISAGQPVTITDPRMTRYWITMDEALFLLTRAAMVAGTGKVFLLDLGEPIQVAAVADRLWAMLGPKEGAMRAEYCGSRPGERLAEELSYADETLIRTDCPYVLQARSSHHQPRPISDVIDWLGYLDRQAESCTGAELRKLLFEFVRTGRG